MIRRVFALDRSMMEDCFYIANQFMDAQNVIAWEDLQFKIQAEQSVMFVDRQYQRGGVGGALMDVYEDFARRRWHFIRNVGL